MNKPLHIHYWVMEHVNPDTGFAKTTACGAEHWVMTKLSGTKDKTLVDCKKCLKKIEATK